ncbi:MAG: hypothetical protein V1722_00410 [Candidatus Micrarchaeota archaeon]
MATVETPESRFFAPMSRHGWLPGAFKTAIHRDLGKKPETAQTLREIGNHFVTISNVQLAKPAIEQATQTLKTHGAQKALQHLLREAKRIATESQPVAPKRVLRPPKPPASSSATGERLSQDPAVPIAESDIVEATSIPIPRGPPRPGEKPPAPDRALKVPQRAFDERLLSFRISAIDHQTLQGALPKQLLEEIIKEDITGFRLKNIADNVRRATTATPLIERSFRTTLGAVVLRTETLKTPAEKLTHLKQQIETLATWAQHYADNRKIHPYALDALTQAHGKRLGSKTHVTPETLASDLQADGLKYNCVSEPGTESILISPNSIKARRNKTSLIAAVVGEFDPTHFNATPYMLNSDKLIVLPRTEQARKFLRAIPRQPTWREKLAKIFTRKKKK